MGKCCSSGPSFSLLFETRLILPKDNTVIDFHHYYGGTVLYIGKSYNSLGLTTNNYVHRSPLPIDSFPDSKSPARIPQLKLAPQEK